MLIRRWMPLVALSLLVSLAGRADAAYLRYSESVTASGSLGSTTYTNSLVTVSILANSDNVVFQGPSRVIQAETATVTIAGIGSATFTVPVSLAKPSNILTNLGFYQGTANSGGLTIIGQNFDSSASYNLNTTYGPETGSGLVGFNSGQSFATSAGLFNIRSISGNVTFVAENAVPEPASIVLVGLGLAGLGAWSARRRGPDPSA